jgi:methylated-DNA-[protein]-cysteine S-methyltransferase
VLGIEASERGLKAIKFLEQEEPYAEPQSENAKNSIALCISALNSYFAKQWGAFEQLRSKIPLDLQGTELQKKVWGIIYSMPNTYPIAEMYYSELASLAGRPDAIRGCANICRQNSMPILIPCHRIVPMNGLVGGYAGGESRKSWLLWHEGAKLKNLKSSILLQQPPQAR